jgi:hypothetical protein
VLAPGRVLITATVVQCPTQVGANANTPTAICLVA